MEATTRRVFYTCSRKSCPFKLTVDYDVTTSGFMFGTYNEARHPRRMLEQMMALDHDQICRGYIRQTELRKTRVTDHVCNTRCTGSTSGICECSCGGANHGGAHRQVAA